MTTRRDFLHMALTAPLLPGALRQRSSDNRIDGPSAHVAPPLYTVLCDDRFEESVAFARKMSSRGTLVTRFQGDITEFWYGDLALRWKTAPVAIAGVTTHGPLFCLERWGWDHGLRIVDRQDLAVPAAHEPLIKWVIAPDPRTERTA